MSGIVQVALILRHQHPVGAAAIGGISCRTLQRGRGFLLSKADRKWAPVYRDGRR